MQRSILWAALSLSFLCVKGQIPEVYKSYVEFSVKTTSPNFTLIKLDTIFIYEIIKMNGKNLEMGCVDFKYFSTKKFRTPINEYLSKNSFVFFGEDFESLRPSNYCVNAIKQYNIQNLVNRTGDSSAFKLNETEYFKFYKTRAIVQKYYCTSKEWYKYYFPLRKPEEKEFVYYEIVKVLNRAEIKSNKFLKLKRVSFFCDSRKN